MPELLPFCDEALPLIGHFVLILTLEIAYASLVFRLIIKSPGSAG
jgi:hypothetical protein